MFFSSFRQGSGRSDHVGPRWTMLDHAGPCWTMLDHVGPSTWLKIFLAEFCSKRLTLTCISFKAHKRLKYEHFYLDKTKQCAYFRHTGIWPLSKRQTNGQIYIVKNCVTIWMQVTRFVPCGDWSSLFIFVFCSTLVISFSDFCLSFFTS